MDLKVGKSRKVFQALLPPKNKNQIANPKGLGKVVALPALQLITPL